MEIFILLIRMIMIMIICNFRICLKPFKLYISYKFVFMYVYTHHIYKLYIVIIYISTHAHSHTHNTYTYMAGWIDMHVGVCIRVSVSSCIALSI